MSAPDLPPGRWSALLVGDQWPGAQSLQVLATTAGARGRAADDLRRYAEDLRSIRDVHLGGQEGLAAEAIREMFRNGETAAREVSEANHIKRLAYESAHRWTEDLRNDLTDIAVRGNADIEAINASEAPQAAKVAEILAVIDGARVQAALKAAGRAGEVAGLVRTVLQQQGIDVPPGDFAAAMGLEVPATRPAADPDTVAQQVSGMLGNSDHHLVAPTEAIAAPPPEITAPGRPAAQQLAAAVPAASGPPIADTPASATVTAPAAPQPATATSAAAPAAAPAAPTETAPGDVPRDLPRDVPRDVPRATPVEPRTAPAESLIAGAPAVAALTAAVAAEAVAATAAPPGPEAPAAAVGAGGQTTSTSPPVAETGSAPAQTVIAAAPTPVAAPPTPAAVIPPITAASPPGGLPAYGADLKAPAAAASAAPPTVAAAPGSAPVNPSAGSGAAGPTAVVRRPESALAATATGAAVGATANQPPGEERIRRLLHCVARQEPRLRWVVAEREDGTVLVTTDLASGWVPPHVRIPAGVALPPPSARCADIARLVGPAVRTLVHRPGDPLPRDSGASAPLSPSARNAPPVDELGWALSHATRWRDGLPRLAHTLATAVFAGTGYLDSEVALLREHLVAVAGRALARYPDATEPGELGNWQLLATLEALIDGEKPAASYHFSWFQAQHRQGEGHR